MTREEFSARFKGSPIKRAKRRGLLRNVAVALGNRNSPEAVPALAVALNGEEPLVRGHAAWALGRSGTEAARQAPRGREDGGGGRVGAGGGSGRPWRSWRNLTWATGRGRARDAGGGYRQAATPRRRVGLPPGPLETFP